MFWHISCFCLVAKSCLTLCHPMDCSTPDFPVLHFCSDSCLLSQWCHPTILFSAAPFSSHLQYFPASGSFLMSQLFASGGQSIGASASASVLPVWCSGLISFRIDWFYLPAVQGTLNSLLQHHNLKASIFQCWAFFMVQFSHLYMTIGIRLGSNIL